MEKLADLPPAALITFGVTLAIIVAVQRFGLWQGEKAAPATREKALLASVIVDPSALNRASAACEGLSEALKDFTKRSDDHTHMLCRRMEAMTDALEGLTVSTNAMIVEMARRSGR
jgi:hypothetical protein